jgi:activator of HSP90 ATPase
VHCHSVHCSVCAAAVGRMDWSEKDCTAWAKDHLATVLNGLELDDAGVARIAEVLQCDGDVLLVNSRGTAKAVYDLSATLQWVAGSKGGEIKAKGLLRIEEITPESLRKGLSVVVKVTDAVVEDAEVTAQVIGRCMRLFARQAPAFARMVRP